MAKKTPNRNEPCSCGSGKKYKRCCEAKVHARGPGATRFLSWGLIAIVAIGVWITVDRIRGGSLSTPEPYEYNAATNKYWDPEHGHWHDGTPPGYEGSASGAAADLPSPAPWTYDAATDKHWDPNHGHWHDGQPPLNPQVSNPEPWQYDTVNDKHWDPNHNHWHDGPPPYDLIGTDETSDATSPVTP